jgi:hypothetical protein
MSEPTHACPGCGLEMPPGGAAYDRKFNASAECWSVFEEVIAAEFQSPALFGQGHQLTVDAYAVQHAGGRHADKSVCVHLVGLHLVLEKGIALADVAPRLQRLAGRVKAWPHFDLPDARAGLTVRDVALAGGDFSEHVRLVRAWAGQVWDAWQPHHGAVRELARDL